MSVPAHNCPISIKIAEAQDIITSLSNRISGLEDALDNPNLPEEERGHFEKELVDIKDILDKNRLTLKGLHKENTKSFAVAACLIFLCFLIYGVYCMMYNDHY